MKQPYRCLVLLIFWIGSVTADPYRLMRLIKSNNNTIDKTVDLVYEIHDTASSPAKKGSRRSKKMLSEQERQLFSPAARGFISTIRAMADKKTTTPAALVWELDDYAIKNSIFENPEDYNDSFLSFIGKQLSKELSTNKKKNIIFVAADNYRRGQQLHNPTDLFVSNEKDKILIRDLIAPLGHLVDLTHSPALQDLAAAKQHANSATYRKLEKLWRNESPIFKEIYDLLDAKRDNTISQFLATVSTDEKERMYEAIVGTIEDLELLLKIFAVPQKHVIIYAGGAHCKQLSEWLTDSFDFQEAFDLGLTQYQLKSHEELFIPIDSNIFNRLALDPMISWQSIKERDSTYSTSTILPPSLTRLSKENIDKLLEHPDALEKIIQQYRTIFVDVPNIYLKQERLFILNYALLHNNFDAAKLLITHGAKPTTEALFIAMKKRHPELVRLLLKHGAQPTNRIYREAEKIRGEVKRVLDEYQQTKAQTTAAKRPLYKEAYEQ